LNINNKAPILKFFLLAIILFLTVIQALAQSLVPVYSKTGLVMSTRSSASDIGMEILKKGGNAVDAAIATGFALAVVYPQAGNIGGGGFMLIRPPHGETVMLDYREKAPLTATPTMYLDSTGAVSTGSSLIGYKACGVPGTVAGFYEAHQRYGKLPWSDLLQPAIELAREGILIDRRMASSLSSKFQILNQFPSSREIFTRRGESLQENDTLFQKDLAAVLQRIQSEGVAGLYTGPVAEKIIKAMEKNNGLITARDLIQYKAVWRSPIAIQYRGFTIYSAAPPSAGGIMLAEIFNALENIHVQQLGLNSSELIHFWVEIERQVYADRSQYLGDPDFIKIPLQQLSSKTYGEKIFQSVNPYYSRTSTTVSPVRFESDHTTHFSVVDAGGMAVSNTYTLNDSYGSGVVIEGTGMLMNNEMDDFVIKTGWPNKYGLTGGTANAIAPGKRMLSSMTPTIVTRSDSTLLILGSPGGSRIITTVAQVISNVLDHHMNIREAVCAPRFHHQWLPDSIFIEENGFTADVVQNLKRKGHNIKIVGMLGDVQAIMRDTELQAWSGWSDPRKDGL
jgi:gamma-glutamyltranspeptidase/glutathione hydrolase